MKFSLYSAVDQKDTTTIHHQILKVINQLHSLLQLAHKWSYMKLNIELKMQLMRTDLEKKEILVGVK